MLNFTKTAVCCLAVVALSGVSEAGEAIAYRLSNTKEMHFDDGRKAEHEDDGQQQTKIAADVGAVALEDAPGRDTPQQEPGSVPAKRNQQHGGGTECHQGRKLALPAGRNLVVQHGVSVRGNLA